MTTNDRSESRRTSKARSTDSGGAPARYRDGLHVDRLNPPHLLAFLRGLPRRLAAVLPPPEGEGHEVGNQAIEPGDLAVVADRLELLIDDLSASGYPIDPRVEVAHPDLELGDRELAEAWRRIVAGSTEGARRLSGIPASGWDAEGSLLASARQAVADLGWQLHRMEMTVRDPRSVEAEMVEQSRDLEDPANRW